MLISQCTDALSGGHWQHMHTNWLRTHSQPPEWCRWRVEKPERNALDFCRADEEHRCFPLVSTREKGAVESPHEARQWLGWERTPISPGNALAP